MSHAADEIYATEASAGRRFLAWLAVWTTLALITAGRNHLNNLRLGYDVPLSTTLVSSFTDFYLWALASILLFRLCRNYPIENPHLLRNLSLFALLSIGLTLVVAVVSVPVFLLLTGGDLGELRDISGSIVFSPWNLYQGFFTFWATVAVGHAINFNRRARDKENRLRNLAVQLADARLNALKMQLQPHFLFNTLNSIAALVRRDADKAEQMIAYLGEFLRMTLTATDENLTSFANEIGFLETYLKIEKIRFQDKLQTFLRIAPETLTLKVPTLILQPIVENAVRHGFADKSENCVLNIESFKIGDRLLVTISDNGTGFSANGGARTTGAGVGLSNTEQRLEETYRGNFRFEFKNNSNGGATVEIEIPADS